MQERIVRIAFRPVLSKNYPNCDADHDRKLTWPDLRACTIDNPPPPERP
jgi:hypothetical protein